MKHAQTLARQKRSLYDSFRLLRRAYPNVATGTPGWEPAVCAMLRLPVEATEEEKQIALLQQLPADSIIQPEDLVRMGYSTRTVEAVNQLAQRPGESLPERTERILATNDPSLIRIEYANQRETAAQPASQETTAELQRTLSWLQTVLVPGTPHRPGLRDTLKFIQGAFGGKIYNNRPFWIHPLSVMFRMQPDSSPDALHAALLHDVVEDTDYTLSDLRHMGYSERTLELVTLVTKQDKLGLGLPKLNYLEEIKTRVIASGDWEGMNLKYSDMSENTSYLDELSPEKRTKVLAKYPVALRLLTDALNAFGQAQGAGR